MAGREYREARKAWKRWRTQPGERPSRNYQGKKPNEADGSRMAVCPVHGDLQMAANEIRKHEIESAHWDREHG